MNLIQCYLTANDCYKSARTITPQGVMVHSTGANNPNVSRYVQPAAGQSNGAVLLATLGTNRYDNDWNRSGLDVCTHAFIGKFADGSVGTAQTLPWNYRGWHAGTGTSGGSANDTHISFEICEDDLKNASYFRQVYKAAVELTALLCKQYNLNPLADGVVICHSEGYQRGIASNHADVMHWFPKFNKSMDTFRADVAAAMGCSGGSTKPGEPGNSHGTVPYTVSVKVTELRIRSGPGTDAAIKGTIKPGVYTIVEEADGPGAKRWGKLKSGAGWISLDYAKRLGSTDTGSSGTSGSASQGFQPYTVKVSVTELRIRSGPGTNYANKGFIDPGVYTIVEEADGPGAKRWGKLKSGAGWISLDYATRR